MSRYSLSEAAHGWSGFRVQNCQRRKQKLENAALGYRWPGAIPFPHTQLHQRFIRCSHRLRYHQYPTLYLDPNSFANLSKWIDNVREVRGEEALIMIVGNKSDLDSERAVENSLASSKITELGLTYM